MTPRGVLAALLAITTAAGALRAQQSQPASPPSRDSATGALVSRALELESAGRNREAIAAWRAVIAAGAVPPGVLGLERVLSILGQEDSLLVALDTLVPRHARDAQVRGAQLRTLAATGRDAAAMAAFREWRDLVPTDVTPYREFARVLLYHNRAAVADTVLREAEATLGSTRALTLEIAQMRAALGLWRESALAWREAMRDEPYFESATVFSLAPAPADRRDGVRTELAAPDAPVGATQALAMLEAQWGAPRRGWQVLAALVPSDTVVAVWRQFADEAERLRAHATARDALSAIHAARPDASVALRAGTAALLADDATAALALARDAAGRLAPERALSDALPIEMEALARLGRAEEAERVMARAAPALGAEGMRGYARMLAWAWIRAGDVRKARAALRDAPIAAEDAVTGWLALYEGDLAGARVALRAMDAIGQDAVSALALLNRTREERSPAIGEAFLTLARGDSARAARRFEAVAGELPDAAPLLLAIAARIETARRDDRRALALWQRVAERHADAPEAPEAFLEWSRGLRRRGDVAGARAKLEHLIITYPGSALVPQARRELEVPTRAADSGDTR